MIRALYRGAGLFRHQSLQPVEEIEGVAGSARRGAFRERWLQGRAPVAGRCQAAPVWRNRAEIEFGAKHRSLSWCAMAVEAVGTGAAGATNGGYWDWGAVFRTGVPTTLGAQVGAISTQIGAAAPGAEVIQSERSAHPASRRHRRCRVPRRPGAVGSRALAVRRGTGTSPLTNTAILQNPPGRYH
jgi:hypothetical protein